MRRGAWCTLVAALTLAPQSGTAQRLEPSPRPFMMAAGMDPSAPELRPTWTWAPDSGRGSHTHRREGAVIGGVAIGLLGAITGVGLCHFDAPCHHPAPFAIGGFLLGALAGVGLGGHIGEQIPKYRSQQPPS